ncbi:TonB-dependent receptor domain-containing protein [Dysgonomonas sp. 25]|uniref:TonB-dependent receptor domain-containing protein n=1 Tax=Dysgonomonas sp. 25 TaxID=2302933 RepID=UPI0013D10208|nr:outer membrane beta-barrel family protein [Dysgonomonas sp. 25]NDV69584.1 TonB-dependent receptor [Dysgonomonas sp. 25]
MKRNLLLFLLLLCSIAMYSQTGNVTVKGLLVDSLTSEPVAYATIRISAKETPDVMLKGFATDDNGKFSFVLNKAGNYIMKIQYMGKKDIVENLTIGDKKTIDFATLLMPDNDDMLGEVVVTAQKPLVQVDLDKITYDMQEDPESKTSNLLDMLKKVPLVTVDGEDNIQLKGSSSYKIYMDGKPSSMIASNPKDVLRSMPASSIKNIEVITDPGAKYDAEGVAGIINIITNKESKLGGYTATLNAGVDNQGSFNAGAYLSLKYGKIGFTGSGSYYNYNNPEGRFASMRETFNSLGVPTSFLGQTAKRKNHGDGQYGSGELSIELDTLNLITIGFNRYGGDYSSRSNGETALYDGSMVGQYYFGQSGKSTGTYGNTSVNADYQRTFSKKDQLLTFSYRFNFNPDDSHSSTNIGNSMGILPPDAVSNYQYTDANMKEHTFQGDFTTPFGKVHNLEAGLKYIIRNNKSNSARYNWDTGTNDWVHVPNLMNDKFRHETDIFAAYAGYSAKVDKWGFKTGLRFESTDLDVKFPQLSTSNFKTDYTNVVPSATITYQLKPSQTLRGGYNMRIWRPGIWQLNPYENTSNPNYITKGNPNLDAVKNHSFNLNYMFFNPKININLNTSYSFENNAIEQYTTVQSGVSTTTYDNIGKNRRFQASTYINWTGIPKLRVMANLWGGYVDIKANNNSGDANNGFTGGGYSNIQYTLPMNFNIGVNGGYFSPNVGLQSKGSDYYHYGLNLRKSFLSDKLNVNVWARSIFQTDRKYKNRMEADTFRYKSFNENRARRFGVYISYRFGEMKAQIKKAKRSISNDDMISGGGGGGQQGGGGE